MPSINLSDLSQMFQLRRDTVRVRQDLATATQELSSGKHADLGKAVSGNFGPLVAIDRQLSSLDAFDTNAREGALFAGAAQMALERVRGVALDFGPRLANLRATDMATQQGVIAVEAREAFSVSVAALNGTVAGRSLFAGTATSDRALAPADEMLAELRLLVTGETTAAGVAGLVETWFGPGGGFETTGYTGSTTDLSGYQASEGQEVAVNVRADNQAIRDQLKGLALAALIEGSDISDPEELADLANTAGLSLMSNQTRVVALQARVGSAQERIEDAMARNGSERTALRMARSEIVDVDPYKVATDLQNLQSQLETIYTITARLSGLSLTNYLR